MKHKSFTPTPKKRISQNQPNKRQFLVLGFTLIELVVAIGIMAIIAGASLPALFAHQKRVQLDEATTQLKDAILSTQNLAFAPDNPDAKRYRFLININFPSWSFNCGGTIDMPESSYLIFRVNNDDSCSPLSQGNISDKVTIDVPALPLPSTDNSFYFIDYRFSDKSVSIQGVNYYTSSLAYWQAKWDLEKFASLVLSESGQHRTIKIDNVSGTVSVENP